MNHEDKDITKYIYGDGIGRVQLVESWGTDLTVVNAARVSYGANKKELDAKDEKLIKYMIDNKHTSPFEHCGATFKFVVPLFVRSQHHRSRTWAYNEISRRYTSENIQFYEPKAFRTQDKVNKQASSNVELINPMCSVGDGTMGAVMPASEFYKLNNKRAIEIYNMMIDAGICREQARGVLPMTTYTEYYGTVSLHNAFKFLELRLTEHAQWEIRVVAEAMLEIMEALWPISVAAWKKASGRDE